MKRLSAVTARHIYLIFGMNGKPEEDFEDFPTLVNLKKTANKYRGAR